jgi:hypothetical protein
MAHEMPKLRLPGSGTAVAVMASWNSYPGRLRDQMEPLADSYEKMGIIHGSSGSVTTH